MARSAAGEEADFEALVRLHSPLAGELRELKTSWEKLARVRAELGHEGSLSERIENRFGEGVEPLVSLRDDGANEEQGADPAPAKAKSEASLLLVTRLSERSGRFGRYRVRGEIARGGMGTILRVWDEDLRRSLAMKVVRESEPAASKPADGKGAEERHESQATRSARLGRLGRFLEEAQVTGQLDHPGIVPVHELGLDPEGRVYFTMKLVKGRTLGEIFDLAAEEKEGWTRAQALRVIHKVCEAMAYAHHKGVIHRDLKPANIMVGRFGEVYVMDWGLARILGGDDKKDLRVRGDKLLLTSELRSDREEHRGDTPDSPLYTMDGDVVGTPAYMSPEQASGKVEEIGACSDVYAVGAMLYHLLAGHMPYVPQSARLNNYAVWSRVQEGPPAPLAQTAPDAPSELVAITERAMERDPTRRYEDMQELAADLAAFLEGRVVRAYETGAVAEAKKWVKRNKPFAAALAAAVLLLIAGLSVSIVLERRSERDAERATLAAARADESAESARNEKTRAESERDKAEKVANFLEETLAAASPKSTPGRDTAILREMMDAAARRIEHGELSAAPEAELRLRITIGGIDREIAAYDAGEALLRRALELARSMHAGDHRDVAVCLENLGVLLKDRGTLALGEPFLREALAMNRRLSPGDDKNLVTSMGSLASLLEARGDFVDAEPLFREALEMSRRLYAGDHSEVATCLNNLANLFHASGNLAAAEPLCREALAMQKVLHKSDHPDVASSLSNLANLLTDRGQLSEVEPLLVESLEMRKRLFPGDHPDVADGLNNLALLRQSRHDLAGAEVLLEQAVEMDKRLFHGDHPDVANGLNNLAALHIARGDLAGAEGLFREALEMYRRLFHGDHQDIATSLDNLAYVLAQKGEEAQAEPLLREALEMQRRIFPGDQPDIAKTLISLARALRSRGDLAGAEKSLREALEMQRRVFHGDHVDMAATLSYLGPLLRARGDSSAAETIDRELLAMRLRLSGPEDRGVASARIELARCLSASKKFTEAEALMLEAEQSLQRSAGAPPDVLREARKSLVELYEAWNSAEPGRGFDAKAAEWR